MQFFYRIVRVGKRGRQYHVWLGTSLVLHKMGPVKFSHLKDMCEEFGFSIVELPQQ